MVSAAATLLIHALVALSLELSGSAYFSGDPSGLQYVWAWMGMWLAGLAGVCLWGFRARVIQARSMGCLIAVSPHSERCRLFRDDTAARSSPVAKC